ncbi:MAG: pilus assembly protein [Planctomycetia bacterium]|nr:pilus assembly protein [Planctomycetia bacterium]
MSNQPQPSIIFIARRRRGISSMELVLVLPILLFVAVLIIDSGTLSMWNIRALSAARDAIWKRRYPQSALAPRPTNWPAPDATVGTSAVANFDVLDEPSLQQPVARGPLPGATVKTNLLDQTRGAVAGTSGLTLRMPVPPNFGTASYNVSHALLDDPWTYDSMGMQGNVLRRTQVLYELAKAPAALSQAFVAAVSAVYFASYQADLTPLQHEPDYPRFGYGSPDFQPQLQSFCGLDAESVRSGPVESLIQRIRGNDQPHVAGVPETMTRSFLSLYRGAIQKLQSQLDANPPLPADQKAQIQQQLTALKAELDPKIAQLEDFLSKLNSP